MTDRILVEISSAPIDPARIFRAATVEDGAVVTFLGVVRGSTGGRAVVGLEYEAYEEMAINEMKKIAGDSAEKWPVSKIWMIHRTGALEVGDISVAIAVAAPHRGEAFDACEYLIDTLKQSVPIWKKELFEDGSASWVEHA